MSFALQNLTQAVVGGVLIGGVYALVAVGLTLIFGVLGLINFAHGEFLMTTMYVTFFSWSLLHLDPLVAIPLAAGAGLLLGLGTYQGLIRPILKGPLLGQIVATFGLSIFLRGLVQLLFTANTRDVPSPWIGSLNIHLGNISVGGPQLVAAVGAVVGTAAIWWFIDRTELGSAVSAVAQDRDAAQLMGINPTRIYILVWAIGGASTGVAGALMMNYFPLSPMIGFNFALVAFVVVVLGGFGSIRGALLAGILLGLIQDVVGLFAPAYGFAAIFVLYLLVVQLRPQGLFGVR